MMICRYLYENRKISASGIDYYKNINWICMVGCLYLCVVSCFKLFNLFLFIFINACRLQINIIKVQRKIYKSLKKKKC